MNNKIFILVFVIVVFIAGGLLYIYNPDPVEYVKPGEEDDRVVCTMDAKMCPDGSYVGRTGPNCEFVCPIPEGTQMEDGTVDVEAKNTLQLQ